MTSKFLLLYPCKMFHQQHTVYSKTNSRIAETYDCFSQETVFFQTDASLSVSVTSTTFSGESFAIRYLNKNKS